MRRGSTCYHPAKQLDGLLKAWDQRYMSNDLSLRASVLAAIALFGAVAVLIVVDLITDYREGVSWAHLAIEGAVLVAAVGGVLVLWRQLHQSRSDLTQARVEAEQWRQENQQLLAGLASAIDGQFRRWGLTGAESEVGLLLLKGLSHKEVAEVRRTSERTVREQSRSLYRKAGLGGRASLSAFFLEDLLLPPDSDTGK
jgi:DNA-binding CsgD family transcriptional regulator